MTINSRQKGARGEREWAAFLTEHGYPARRGQQFSGSPDSPDVVCESLGHLSFEVKRVQAGNPYNWLDQAIRDAGPNKTPVVAHRRNGRDWMIVMRAADFMGMLNGGAAARGGAE